MIPKNVEMIGMPVFYQIRVFRHNVLVNGAARQRGSSHYAGRASGRPKVRPDAIISADFEFSAAGTRFTT